MDEILIPFGKSAEETAVLLLGAAEDQGYEPYVVRYQPEDNGFRVPADVAKAARLGSTEQQAQKAVKKTAAKKSATKQSSK